QRRRLALRRGLRLPGGRGRPWHPVAADHDEHRPDRDDLAFLDEDLGDLPGGRRGDLDRRLVGLDLDEWIVLCDFLSLGDEPARDLALGQPLPEVRQLELVRHQAILIASSRRTACTPLTPLTICVTCRSTATLPSAVA